MKSFHARPPHLRHASEKNIAHLAWAEDFGLAEPSTVASPLYKFIGRKAVKGGTNSWTWRYRGRYVDGTESPWLTESEAGSSFTPCSWAFSMPCGKRIRGPTAGQGPPQGVRERKETRKRGNKLCKNTPRESWCADTSRMQREGINDIDRSSTTTSRLIGGSVRRW